MSHTPVVDRGKGCTGLHASKSGLDFAVYIMSFAIRAAGTAHLSAIVCIVWSGAAAFELAMSPRLTAATRLL